MRTRPTPAQPVPRLQLAPVVFSQILDALPAGVVIVDTDGAPIFTNRAARELLGVGIAGALEVSPLGGAYPLHVVATETIYPAARLPVARALRGERAVVADVEVRHPRGRTPVTIEAVPLTTDRQGVVLAAAVFLEPTEQRATTSLQTQLAAMIESSEDAITQFSLDGTIEAWNPAAERMHGYTALEAVGKSVEMLVPRERKDELTFLLRRVGAGERLQHMETVRLRKDGSIVHVSVSARPVWGGSGGVVAISATSRDMSDLLRAQQRQRELEEQLRHARKMEEVGRFAGGVAHDFNTLLTVISAHAQFLRDSLKPQDEAAKDVSEILNAVDRGARLTASLLGYSRKESANPVPVDVNEVVQETAAMLQRVIGEKIDVQLQLEPGLGRVLIERSHLEQVIMNLTLNGRDAMPDGGTLKIRTARAWVDADSGGAPHGGAYAELTVSDTGFGMNSDTAHRIFDPYFTTKDQRGTGLGLSTVYRIVTQSGGHVAVHSEPGVGTRVSLFFPLLGIHRAEQPKEPEPGKLARGRETVLVVDDDESLCAATKRLLENEGYTVVATGYGSSAERLVREFEGELHLVVADVTSDSRVRDFLEELSDSRPHARVVFMSGYSDEAGRAGMMGPGVSFIAKPYTSERLLRTMREVLEAPLIEAD